MIRGAVAKNVPKESTKMQRTSNRVYNAPKAISQRTMGQSYAVSVPQAGITQGLRITQNRKATGKKEKTMAGKIIKNGQTCCRIVWIAQLTTFGRLG